jgi:hypothetical protein
MQKAASWSQKIASTAFQSQLKHATIHQLKISFPWRNDWMPIILPPLFLFAPWSNEGDPFDDLHLFGAN